MLEGEHVRKRGGKRRKTEKKEERQWGEGRTDP